MKAHSPVWLTLFCTALLSVAARAEPSGTALRIIEHLKMQKVPGEGIWFALNYVSDDRLPGSALPARYKGQDRPAGSAIYNLMTREDFSAMHKLETDESWHYYSGDPMEMLLLHPDGRGETITLGPDLFAGQVPQVVVRRGTWQGAAPAANGKDGHSFGGNQLGPGFDYADFRIGYRDELQKRYPAFAEHIARLTREEFAVKPAASPTAPEPVGAPLAMVFSEDSVKRIEVAPGMMLRELVGRKAVSKSERYSVASFSLEKGKSTLVSYNKVSEETFLITRGRGRVTLNTDVRPVTAGTVVTIPPGVRHALAADAEEGLEFFVVEAPAFSPDDYVVVPPAAAP